jgi:hypothetical protein
VRGPAVAIGDAGLVPFVSGWRTLDIVGLNDRDIARFGTPARLARFAAERPAVLVVVSERPDQFEPWLASDGPLLDAALRRGMTRVGTLRFMGDYYLWVIADPSVAPQLHL